ncbi:MAG: C1 family peptidase [Eubacteriales bacterium]|nr:C1 family peptidase [Eubacteriales bacterium]
MKKRTKAMIGKVLSLLLAGSLAAGQAPVAAGELFTDVPEESFFLEEDEDAAASEGLVDVPEPSEEAAAVGGPEEAGPSEEASPFTAPEMEALLDDGTEEGQAGQGAEMTQEEIEAQLLPMENLKEISCAEPPRSNLGGINGSRSYGEAAQALPEKYDTRGVYTTDVKNQKPYGMCWAFTTAAGLETSLLMKGLGLYDLSEEHLAYFFANRMDDPLGNTANDRNVVYDSYREGGNQVLASIFLSTWSGMGLEYEAPYATDVTHTQSYRTRPAGELAYRTTAYLTDAVFTDYDVAKMKQLILSYGAVGLSLWLDVQYYNVEKSAYCCSDGAGKANHAVTLVGWDDAYPKENFPASSRVTRDGAWIAKNSWGTQWGDDGYFYVSYENKSNYNIVAEAGTTSPAYPNNYFYDGSSALSSFSLARSVGSGASSATKVANIFHANAGKGKGEVLGEVVLATHSDISSFGIQVYTNLTDPDDPESGIPAYPEPVSFYQPYAGISTVSIPEVELMQGTLYSVVLTNRGNTTIDYLVETEGDYGWVGFQAGLSPQQSFVYSKSYGWSDLYPSDMCMRIKAHTRTMGAAVHLGAPTEVKAVSKDYNRIGLSWKGTDKASGYEIYRKKSGGRYKKAATVGYDTVAWTDKKAETGVKYAYKLRAYSLLNGRKAYSGYSPAVSRKAVLTAPAVSVKGYGSVRNKVNWKKVAGAHGYLVYRRAEGKRWKLIATVKSSKARSYMDSTPAPCGVYEYAVRAYRNSGGKMMRSSYGTSGKWKTSGERQRVTALKNEAGGIRISWKTQKNSDGYFVYRKQEGGRWQRIARINKGRTGSCLDDEAVPGQTYTYYVRAFVKNGGRLLQSRYAVGPWIKRNRS